MARRSAGLLAFRRAAHGELEVLLVHPGGPFWARKDDGAWSIPKGEYEEGEDPEACARREFAEELGVEPPSGPLLVLGEVRQSGGKRVTAWAVEGSVEPDVSRSTTFSIEWPPRSGRTQVFPEVDRAEWFDVPTARRKLLRGQLPLLEALVAGKRAT